MFYKVAGHRGSTFANTSKGQALSVRILAVKK